MLITNFLILMDGFYNSNLSATSVSMAIANAIRIINNNLFLLPLI